MVEVLNKAGPFSKNSEVVIAAPSIHLSSMMCAFRPEISVAAEDVGFKKGYGAYTGKQHNAETTSDIFLISFIHFTHFVFLYSNCLMKR
jgi:hypothetical protein